MRQKIVSLMDLTSLDRQRDTDSSVAQLVLQGRQDNLILDGCLDTVRPNGT